MHQLLDKYADIFAYTPDQLGSCTVVKHTIDTGQHSPIRLRSYRTSPTNREQIEKQVNEMLKSDIISPSVSPWDSPGVLVRKSEDTMRFCVNYRKLNQITRKDCHPLHRITWWGGMITRWAGHDFSWPSTSAQGIDNWRWRIILNRKQPLLHTMVCISSMYFRLDFSIVQLHFKGIWCILYFKGP